MKKILLTGITLLCMSSTMQALDFGNQLELPDFNSGKIVWVVRAGIGFNNAAGSYKETQELLWNDAKLSGNFSSFTGYDFSFGFNKSFGEQPLYWGMDLALGMRGYHSFADKQTTLSISSSFGWSRSVNNQEQEQSLKTYNIQFSPVTIGYKYLFMNNMAADIHLGGYISYDFAGDNTFSNTDITYYNTSHGDNVVDNSTNTSTPIGDIDSLHRLDVGLNLGIGYWFGHFNIDLTWQRGFISFWDNGDDVVTIGSGKNKITRKSGNLYTNNVQLRLGYAF